ncbi:MAG: hypothetical protein GF364_08265 [Candidatus Lokiarchaeota archaeon]|nr:hypothetical protein [Candidatus Lokiarchaeota archaeon]
MSKIELITPGTVEYRILVTFLFNREPKKPSDLKKILNIPHSTLNSALERMSELLEWHKYGLVKLKEKGNMALEHIENHRHLIDIFLQDSLNIDKETAYDESIKLAPHFSCTLIRKLCERYPTCAQHVIHIPYFEQK